MSKSHQPARKMGRASPVPGSRSGVSGEGNPERQSHVSRREWLCVLIVLAAGAILRLAFPSRLAIEHFDEGVYASNVWFDREDGYGYPYRHLYAPPLLPGLIEGAMITAQLLGRGLVVPPAWVVLLPSLIAGCATVGLMWWIARSWFGEPAALITLTLAAASDFHAQYTRAALTDALLVCFFLLAIWLIERACRTGSAALVIAAGVATACAWWTKYNGWLPLAIALGGIALQGLIDRQPRVVLVRRLGCWLLIAAVAFLLWCPFLFSLQSRGGYAAVAANHRQYLTGLEGWLGSLLRQHANLRHFDGGFSVFAWVAVGLLIGLSGACRGTEGGESSCRGKRWWPIACGGVLASSGAYLGTDVTLLLLALVGLVMTVCRIAGPGGAGLKNDSAPGAYLLTWCLGLLIVTPLYHPYPRLVLPWLCGMWLGAGLSLATLCRARGKWFGGGASVRTRAILAGVCLVGWVALAGKLPAMAEQGVAAWQARTGLQRIAGYIQSDLERLAAKMGRPASETVVYVYGEPALFYQLRALGMQLVAPVQTLPPAGPPDAGRIIVLATGPHAHRSPQFARQWSERGEDFAAFASYEYRPSDLVDLDPYDPRTLGSTSRGSRQEVRLYLVR